jgi:iron(III) transport system ATP-binding protein
MTRIVLDNIAKQFDSTVVLQEINLQIEEGELFFLLGPSGCGKSTLLRIVAGLLPPTSGRIFFNDRDVTDLGTEKRNAVMCFQSYALWPHMSVRENVRFGLNVRKMGRADQSQRIEEVLKMVRMDALADRKPNELSGGQQQRVALARALAVRPDCLLLDEPLSNLDAKLRQEMRSEIRRICKSAGLTSIYVTHDQKEALSAADRIAIMKDGRLMQVGTPGDLYHRPRTSFVADFIGQTNLLRGQVKAREGAWTRVETSAGSVLVSSQGQLPANVVLSLRPERMKIEQSGQAPNQQAINRLVGKVLETTFLGEASEHLLQVGAERLKVITEPLFQPPPELVLTFDPADVTVLAE